MGRALADIESGKVTEVELRLAPAGPPPKQTVEERLAVYGLSHHQLKLSALTVRHRTTLDYRAYPDKHTFSLLKPKSVNDLKKWVGIPDSAFGHDQPRFGPFTEIATRRLESPVSLTGSDGKAIQAIAREYIYGNAQSLSASQTELVNRYISLATDQIAVSIFYFTTVTIDDGAVLEIGNGSSVFFAEVLRIHRNGTLAVVGDVRADIGIYEQFG
ncbi:MAG: hypothetical protein ACRDG4_02035 [Chloroflexota bacterium]